MRRTNQSLGIQHSQFMQNHLFQFSTKQTIDNSKLMNKSDLFWLQPSSIVVRTKCGTQIRANQFHYRINNSTSFSSSVLENIRFYRRVRITALCYCWNRKRPRRRIWHHKGEMKKRAQKKEPKTKRRWMVEEQNKTSRGKRLKKRAQNQEKEERRRSRIKQIEKSAQKKSSKHKGDGREAEEERRER